MFATTTIQYGINDICLSLPFVVGAQGIKRVTNPPLTPDEDAMLVYSAKSLTAMKESLML